MSPFFGVLLSVNRFTRKIWASLTLLFRDKVHQKIESTVPGLVSQEGVRTRVQPSGSAF